MKKKSLTIAILLASLLSVMGAIYPTYLDWQLNPGGLFHDNMQTDWCVTGETFASWFFPLWIILLSLNLTGLLLGNKIKEKINKP